MVESVKDKRLTLSSAKISMLVKRSAYYPWFILLLCSSLLFYKYVLSVSPSSMTDDLMRAFHISGVGLGNIGAAFYYTYTLMQIFVGLLLDRYNTRLLASASILISALGALLFAMTHTFWLALVARALMGFGAAFATVTYLKMAAIWFKPQQLAFVSGLLATAVMVGAVCGVAPLAYLVHLLGWRGSLLGIAVVGLLFAISFLLLVKEPPDSMLAAEGKPLWSATRFRGAILDVMANRQNWLLTFYNGLAFVPLTLFAGLWGNPFLRAMYPSISTKQAGWLLSLTFVGLGIGAPFLGLLSDYWGKRRSVMLMGLLLSLASVSAVIYMTTLSYAVLAWLLFLFGFGTGAFMLVFSIGRQINALSTAAMVIAMINTGELLNSITEPLIGKLLDIRWTGKMLNGVHIFSTSDYQLAFSLLPIYLMLAVIVLYFIREP